jgi:hypothetical protein
MNLNKKMVNYFKRWEGMNTLGVGLLALGFLFLWVGMSYLTYILSVISMLFGVAAFLYGNIGRGNATQIEDTIRVQRESFRFPELEEDNALRKRTPKEPEVLTFEGFEMRNGLYFKKKKDASVISSEYTCIKAIVLNDALYLKKCTFSLVSDERSMQTLDIPFSAIHDIEVIRNTLLVGHGEKPEHRVKTCHIAITYGDGESILLPKQEDAYIDDYAQNLKKKFGI